MKRFPCCRGLPRGVGALPTRGASALRQAPRRSLLETARGARSSVSMPAASRTTKPTAAASIAATISGPANPLGSTAFTPARNASATASAAGLRTSSTTGPPTAAQSMALRAAESASVAASTSNTSAAESAPFPRASPEESSTKRKAGCAPKQAFEACLGDGGRGFNENANHAMAASGNTEAHRSPSESCPDRPGRIADAANALRLPPAPARGRRASASACPSMPIRMSPTRSEAYSAALPETSSSILSPRRSVPATRTDSGLNKHSQGRLVRVSGEQPRHRACRHRQPKAGHHQGVHPHHVPARVGQWPAGISRRKLHVRLNPLGRAESAAATDGVNDPRGYRSHKTQRIADGNHQFADAQVIGIRQRDGSKIRRRECVEPPNRAGCCGP